MEKERKYVIDNATLMLEWDYAKNNEVGLTPESVTVGSNKKAFWICKKHNTAYQQSIKNKHKGQRGCMICQEEYLHSIDPKRYLKGKLSLAETHPDLLKEWDYNKNSIQPTQVAAGSGRTVWWKCSNGHEWQARICNRTAGSNCIYCTGQRPVIGENDLLTTNPELVDEWDWEKNGDLRPEHFMKGSNISVWWHCSLGHSWKASISHRAYGTGCPHCYSENQTSFAEQAIVFYLSHYTVVENRKKICGKEIDIFLPHYQLGFEYDGMIYHNTKKSKIREETKDLVLQQNGIKLFRIKESNRFEFDKNSRIIFCRPDNEYRYIANIMSYIQHILNIHINEIDISGDRIKIYNQYIQSVKSNSIAIRYPHLVDEWDYEKNGNLSPHNFTFGSTKKVWWHCKKCNSSYLSSIQHKVAGTNCPYCVGKKVNDTNSLSAVFPELKSQWDYENNGNTSPDIIYYSSRVKVWWVCQSCGKSYEMAICTKIKAKTAMCPSCMHKHIGRKNRQLAVEREGSLLDIKPNFLEDWDYEKNVFVSPNEVTVKSGIKVWWKCKQCGHEWKTSIHNRFSGTGCPMCYRKNRTKPTK